MRFIYEASAAAQQDRENRRDERTEKIEYSELQRAPPAFKDLADRVMKYSMIANKNAPAPAHTRYDHVRQEPPDLSLQHFIPVKTQESRDYPARSIIESKNTITLPATIYIIRFFMPYRSFRAQNLSNIRYIFIEHP